MGPFLFICPRPLKSQDRPCSGQAFADDFWYQPNMNTTSIAGVINIIEPSFHATLRAGRTPLRLRLTTDISFFGYIIFQTVRQKMHVTCDVLVGANGSLLRESVGATCDSYSSLLDDDDDD